MEIACLAIPRVHSDTLSTATLARMQREKPDLETLTEPERGHAPLLAEPECMSAFDPFFARRDPNAAVNLDTRAAPPRR